MPSYNFKRDCKVYVVTDVSGTLRRYQLEVYPDLSFSQTFDEQSRNVKTLHDQDAMFEEAIINKANPANFSFTVLMNDATAFDIVTTLLTSRNPNRDGSVEGIVSSDLYVDTGYQIFKLTKGAIERATYQIQRDSLITVSIQGVASRLQVFGLSGTAMPGTFVPVNHSVQAVYPARTRVDLNSVEVPNIAGISIEVANTIEWLNYDTLHKSLEVTGPADTMFPEAFVVSSKVLSGSITQYLTSTNGGNLQTWSTDSPLRIRVGNPGPVYFLDVNMPTVVFTNRLQTDDAFMQVYDFRMTSNSVDLEALLGYSYVLLSPTNTALPIITGVTVYTAEAPTNSSLPVITGNTSYIV